MHAHTVALFPRGESLFLTPEQRAATILRFIRGYTSSMLFSFRKCWLVFYVWAVNVAHLQGLFVFVIRNSWKSGLNPSLRDNGIVSLVSISKMLQFCPDWLFLSFFFLIFCPFGERHSLPKWNACHSVCNGVDQNSAFSTNSELT